MGTVGLVSSESSGTLEFLSFSLYVGVTCAPSKMPTLPSLQSASLSLNHSWCWGAGHLSLAQPGAAMWFCVAPRVGGKMEIKEGWQTWVYLL